MIIARFNNLLALFAKLKRKTETSLGATAWSQDQRVFGRVPFINAHFAGHHGNTLCK
jgi:hypothetical protein